jgi:hypothetical protein
MVKDFKVNSIEEEMLLQGVHIIGVFPFHEAIRTAGAKSGLRF